MNDPIEALCDDEQMREVLSLAEANSEGAVAAIDELLTACPRDPRLYFLKGSLLVGLKRFIGAHKAMSQALAIAPDYHLARFQLGFFELTSGETEAARQTWQPLDALPAGHWIRLFTDGLRHLADDRFTECIAKLRAGIDANDENLPLNADMQLIIEQCERLTGSEDSPADAEDISATSFLLGRSTGGRRH